jgi:integrase
MTTNWTDNKIRALKATSERQEIALRDGLYLIIQPSGARSFAFRYRAGKRPVKLKLGDYFGGDVKAAPEPKIGGFLTLETARQLVWDTRAQITKGTDPVAAKKEAKQAKQQADENTFEAVALNYLQLECGMKNVEGGKPAFDDRKRSAGAEYATLKRLVFPVIGKRPISQIRRLEINHLLDKIQKERGLVMRDRTLAAIRTIMGWHAIRDETYNSPIVKGMAKAKQADRARKRVLFDDELRAVWKVSGEMNDPFGALVRFLLLTAARRTEASALPWSEIKDGVWTLPKERNKTKVELVRPLSAVALIVLPPRIEGCKYVFSYDGRRALTGFVRTKQRLDEAVAKELGGPIENWTLHDLRRTARSLMAKARVPREYAEKCLGHVIGGVEGTYDRHDYLAEMRIAYEALAQQIWRIVDPPEDNVVVLHKTGE